MKNSKMLSITISLITFLGVFGSAQAQETIKYKMLLDSPEVVPNNYVYLHYFDYIGRMSNAEKRHRAVRGLGASVNALFHVDEKQAVEFSFHLNHADLRSSVKKYPVKTDVSFLSQIGTKKRDKDVKINVRAFKTVVGVTDLYGNFRGYHDAVGVDQITVGGTEGLTRYVRAGLQYQNGSYETVKPRVSGTYNTAAVFIGFVQESRIHVDVELLDRVATSAQYMRTYFDLMVFPVATTTLVETGKRSLVGFRVGGMGHFPKMKNFMNYMAPKVEIGMNALDGWYWQVGLGLNVYNSH